MVNYSSRLDNTFAALADPTRRAILTRLARGDISVGELAEPFRVSLPAVSKHLRVLERAGLLTQSREGRVRHCRLRAAPMRAAAAWIDRYRRFWTDQLADLAAFFEPPGARESRSASDDPAPDSTLTPALSLEGRGRTRGKLNDKTFVRKQRHRKRLNKKETE